MQIPGCTGPSSRGKPGRTQQGLGQSITPVESSYEIPPVRYIAISDEDFSQHDGKAESSYEIQANEHIAFICIKLHANSATLFRIHH
jgi:hypothetical protein